MNDTLSYEAFLQSFVLNWLKGRASQYPPSPGTIESIAYEAHQAWEAINRLVTTHQSS